MSFHLGFSEEAMESLRHIDPTQRNRIVKWLEKNVDGSDNPRRTGKLHTGNHAGLWRYRVGDYRIICDIQDGLLLVLVVDVGHRKNIY